MSLSADGSELQCSLWRQDQDRAVEELRATLWRRVVVLDVKNRLDGYWWIISAYPNVNQPSTEGHDSRLRPDLPISVLLLEGCLLLHRMALSYGASQTQRLWRSLLLSSRLVLSATPNDFRLLTYLYIHSPTIV